MSISRGSGRVIAVLGPDGSGKSTFCESLVEGHLSRSRILRLHHRPGVFFSSSPQGAPLTQPHGGKPYSRIMSCLKLALLFLDFSVGWWLRIAPFLRKGGWVLWERPWWDIVIDPMRYRLQGCTGGARLLGAILPQPDLTVVLEAPPEVLLERKREVTRDELIRQTKELRHIVPKGGRVVFLDSTQPIATLVQRAEREFSQLTPSS
jgi:thymidylate kinase